MPVLYIDAMNVIGSRPDGWWRDRDGALRRLVADLQAYAGAAAAEVVVVADGRPVDGLEEGRHGNLEVVYALRGGRDGADDRIVDLVGEASARLIDASAGVREGSAAVIEVVTADRELGERVREFGADVVGPTGLRRRVERCAGDA